MQRQSQMNAINASTWMSPVQLHHVTGMSYQLLIRKAFPYKSNVGLNAKMLRHLVASCMHI